MCVCVCVGTHVRLAAPTGAHTWSSGVQEMESTAGSTGVQHVTHTHTHTAHSMYALSFTYHHMHFSFHHPSSLVCNGLQARACVPARCLYVAKQYRHATLFDVSTWGQRRVCVYVCVCVCHRAPPAPLPTPTRPCQTPLNRTHTHNCSVKWCCHH